MPFDLLTVAQTLSQSVVQALELLQSACDQLPHLGMIGQVLPIYGVVVEFNPGMVKGKHLTPPSI